MATPRKLMLLDPSKKLLKDFQTNAEQVIDGSKELLDSVPKVPSVEITEEHLEGARDLLDCMVVIQGQLKDLQTTYKHMKKYIETVCIDGQVPNIQSKDAIGFLSSRTQFDQKIFKEQNPDMYQNYIKQTAPFLVVKKRKK